MTRHAPRSSRRGHKKEKGERLERGGEGRGEGAGEERGEPRRGQCIFAHLVPTLPHDERTHICAPTRVNVDHRLATTKKEETQTH